MDPELHEAIRALAWGSRLLERASGELTMPQYRVLSLVASSPERAARLAQRAAVSRPTLSAALDGLERRGLLRRRGVEDDRRGVRLEVTPDGRAALRRAESSMGERLAAILSRAPDPDAVVAGLGVLLAALEADLDDRNAHTVAGEPLPPAPVAP